MLAVALDGVKCTPLQAERPPRGLPGLLVAWVVASIKAPPAFSGRGALGNFARPMAAPRIGLDQVRHVARLSALALEEEELQRLGPQLAAIIEHVAQLDEVDTEGVEPTAHPSATTAPLREDRVVPSLPREQALAAAPTAAHGAFAVPKVLE